MIISLDIETSCAVKECPGFGGYKKCKHALHFKKNNIDVIGAYWEENGNEKYEVFRDLDIFTQWVKYLNQYATFVGHNFKFDLKTLQHKCPEIKDDLENRWAHDTQVMAVACTEKIDNNWLEWYEDTRKKINKQQKTSHRSAAGYSLKTLAPYFIKATPFWESDDKDDDEYVIADCRNTYKLAVFFIKQLRAEGTLEFYKKLFAWNYNLYKCEIIGVRIDLDILNDIEKLYADKVSELKKQLDEIWSSAYIEYFQIQCNNIKEEYNEKIEKAVEKASTTKLWEKLDDKGKNVKVYKIKEKYRALQSSKIDALDLNLNLDSPAQLAWLFRDYLKYDIIYKGKETTGKHTIEKLIKEGKEDIKIFDEYRKTQKILTSFIPTYKEMVAYDEIYDCHVLHCSFNIGGTRTGRLSSSEPNLQQVPPILRKIFTARKGYKLATYDESAIEPHIIAYFSEDMNLYKEITSGDFHGEATRQFFEYVNVSPTEVKAHYKKERTCAKQMDLSFFYGSGVGMAVETALKHGYKWTDQDAKYKLQKFKHKFKQVFKFKEELDELLESGEVVTNVMGRKFKFSDPTDVYMKGFNSLIQGSASDIVLNSAYKINKKFSELGIDGRVLLLVHDEIITEIPEDREEECKKIIIDCMTDYALQTCHGMVELKVEGEVANTWEK
jgi:DNA polymerase I-like protein with 3'-5' exonuclease and polymerase domains